jgi:hypothetical protein
VEDTMRAFYPSCKRFIEDEWRAIIEEYRRTYPNRSFEFHRCAQHFPQFISEQEELVEALPFLPDLAWYEWLEMDVYHAPNEPLPLGVEARIPQSLEALAALRPVKNPILRIRAYAYPTPQIVDWLASFEGMPEGRVQFDPNPCQVLTYRDPDTLEARYFQLTPLTASFMSRLTPERSYREILETLQQEEPSLQAIPSEVLLAEGLKLIHNAFTQKILLGSLPHP